MTSPKVEKKRTVDDEVPALSEKKGRPNRDMSARAEYPPVLWFEGRHPSRYDVKSGEYRIVGRRQGIFGTFSNKDGDDNELSRDLTVRVYVDGIFDLFHPGHASTFWQAIHPPEKLLKKIGCLRRPGCRFEDLRFRFELIVGVCSDEETHTHKGQTVQSIFERVESVRQCRFVSGVVANCPYWVSKKFLMDLDIDYLSHDTPYGMIKGRGDPYQELKDSNMFLGTTRVEITGNNAPKLKETSRSLRHEVYDKFKNSNGGTYWHWNMIMDRKVQRKRGNIPSLSTSSFIGRIVGNVDEYAARNKRRKIKAHEEEEVGFRLMEGEGST